MRDGTEKGNGIIRRDALKAVEQVLQDMGVEGISVTQVRGYGEYADTYRDDWLVSHARLEIFTGEDQAEPVAEAIMGAAHTGNAGDGVVAILPVLKLYRIRTRDTVEG
ncbi:MAG TPA: P-II family nitrogen regulator [Gammaproteobacteria bacterium]|nr:P-II family nitrogen regulator [Gammaproteobacteria bacterium]